MVKWWLYRFKISFYCNYCSSRHVENFFTWYNIYNVLLLYTIPWKCKTYCFFDLQPTNGCKDDIWSIVQLLVTFVATHTLPITKMLRDLCFCSVIMVCGSVHPSNYAITISVFAKIQYSIQQSLDLRKFLSPALLFISFQAIYYRTLCQYLSRF